MRTRRWLPWLVVGCVLLAGCGDDRRSAVEAYVRSANALQRDAAPALARAERAYARFSRTGGAVPAGPLRRAERVIHHVRTQLARQSVPPEAADLQRALLRFYALGEGLAHETTLFGAYRPAASRALGGLGRANARLDRALKSAGTDPVAQAAAVGGYATAVGRALRALGRIQPPPLLAPAHRLQQRRLDGIRRLALRLKTAILARDTRTVATELERFRRLNAGSGGGRRLAAAALRRYQARRRALAHARGRIARAENRLQQRLQ